MVLKLLTLGVCLYAAAAAQVKSVGAVTAIDAAGRTLTIKSDLGPELLVKLTESAKVLRVAPGETSLAKAQPVSLADVAPGDRILARGTMTPDEKAIDATTVVLMAKSDLARKQEAERAEWSRRGIAGTVKSIDPAAKTVVIQERAAFAPMAGPTAAPKEITINLSKAELRRYAPGSVKFADAAPGELSDVRAGDQIRALGEKGDGGAPFTAEMFVSGSFRNLAVTVKSVDATAGTLVVTDLDTKKTLTIASTRETNLRKMPEMMARMMAMRASGTLPARPGGAPPGAVAMRGPGGPPAGPGGGDFLERMPAFALSDLKAGDALIIASTATDAAKATAIAMVAGVEPILEAAPAAQRQMMVGSWNLDMSPGMTP